MITETVEIPLPRDPRATETIIPLPKSLMITETVITLRLSVPIILTEMLPTEILLRLLREVILPK